MAKVTKKEIQAIEKMIEEAKKVKLQDDFKYRRFSKFSMKTRKKIAEVRKHIIPLICELTHHAEWFVAYGSLVHGGGAVLALRWPSSNLSSVRLHDLMEKWAHLVREYHHGDIVIDNGRMEMHRFVWSDRSVMFSFYKQNDALRFIAKHNPKMIWIEFSNKLLAESDDVTARKKFMELAKYGGVA